MFTIEPFDRASAGRNAMHIRNVPVKLTPSTFRMAETAISKPDPRV
jgi:hypothetical protein